jgi:hypothetical protein
MYMNPCPFLEWKLKVLLEDPKPVHPVFVSCFCLCDDLPGWLELVDLLVRPESYAKDHVAVV